MGSPKALLPLDSTTYLQTIFATLETAGVAPIRVVLGHGAAEILAAVALGDTAVVLNEGWRRGMLSSLQLGLRSLHATPAQAALVALVDSPRFSVDTARALVSAFEQSAAPIVVPAHAGEHGHPVVFSRALWPELLRAPAETGARTVVNAHRAEIHQVAVDDPWVLHDADTPAQHGAMRRGELE